MWRSVRRRWYLVPGAGGMGYSMDGYIDSAAFELIEKLVLFDGFRYNGTSDETRA